MSSSLKQEDAKTKQELVSRLIRGITGVSIWVIGIMNLLTKST